MRAPEPQPVRATYRVQLTPAFGFRAAVDLVPYLAALGVTHLYTSPCLEAVPGSRHGYDVVNYDRANPELGGESGRRALCRALERKGMGWVLDVVPNHMAIDTPRNRLWWDVLKHGRASPFAGWFDIDWDPPDRDLKDRVLLPILGDDLDAVLADGSLRLDRHEGEPVWRYHAHVIPLRPDSDAAVAGGLMRRGGDARALRRLADFQHYALADWREANRRINYRRFFSINSLAGLRVESDPVFRFVHGCVLGWIGAGELDGLRIDHPDGLRDPRAYLQRLRHEAPSTWTVVEKILCDDETLPCDWPVAGTTGYDFMNRVSGLFVDPEGEAPLTACYAAFTGDTTDYAETVRRRKRDRLASAFGGEIRRLDALARDALPELGAVDSRRLRAVLCEWIAAFPVYRTYLRPDDRAPDPTAKARIGAATEAALRHVPPADRRVLHELTRLLMREVVNPAGTEFAMRFQQLCAPAMAKGVEDSALYCFNRLVSLNEVGGDPARFGVSPRAFHAYCLHLQAEWPYTMTATSTHDTKRGEDTRLRIHTLSEIPSRWQDAVGRWTQQNRGLRRTAAIDARMEYFLYQTLVGVWPIDSERLRAYLVKAAREAGQRTNWEAPDAAYESALCAFADGVPRNPVFINDLVRFLEPLLAAAHIASLSQTTIKYSAPGVPDCYQGGELWDLSLVDPDNRRPVDYARRANLLDALGTLTVEQILARMREGLPKLWVIRQALALRRRRPAAFDASGAYDPIYAQGPKADHLVAFLRGGEVMCAAPRLLTRLANDWAGTTVRLPPGSWRNVLDGSVYEAGSIAAATLFERFPTALLEHG